jgi:hypothetical protein
MPVYDVNGRAIVIESDEKAEAMFPGAWVRLRDDPAPKVDRRITNLAFLSRFTDAEAVAIDLASIGATVQAAGIRRYVKKVDAASFIDLDRPDTRAGVQALEAAGLLAVGRAAEILDGVVQAAEQPQ